MIKISDSATTRFRAPFAMPGAVSPLGASTAMPVRGPWSVESVEGTRPSAALRPQPAGVHPNDAGTADVAGTYVAKQGSPPRGEPR